MLRLLATADAVLLFEARAANRWVWLIAVVLTWVGLSPEWYMVCGLQCSCNVSKHSAKRMRNEEPAKLGF